MLIGEYSHSIDNKGRINMPSKFRDDLGESFIVSKGLDNCLFMYSLSEWEEFKKKILDLKMAQARDLQRFFFSSAYVAEVDKQGRILIPNALREYANLSKDVMVIGVSSRAELWDKEQWLSQSATLTSDNIAKALEEIGF